MRDKPIFLTCLHTFLLFAPIFAFFSMFHVSYAEVIRVPQEHPTIQQAIDAASAGDTINVSRRSGESQSVYYERLVIDKQLTLVGESRETIIIDGGGIGTVIRIQADTVEIKGFTVRNGGQKYSGIRTNSYSYVTIANNTIKTNKNGVVFINSHYNTVVQNLLFNNSASSLSLSESLGNTISDNNVSQSAFGIKLSSTNATFVVGNMVADNSYGIYLEHSSNDTVDKNTLLRNGVDGILPHACQQIVVSNNEVSESAYGIQLYNSDLITVLGNDATDNSYGIYLAYSGPSNTIENNTISRNDWGVTLYGSSGNTFKGNTLSYNIWGVDPVAESNNNLLYHNNFVENIVEQVVWNPDCVNTWDDGYPSGGNYWSDYTGTDSNGDGIGDTQYIIDPMNKDRYPLMNLWGMVHDIAIVGVELSPTEVSCGEVVNITVLATNEGNATETFDVTTYYNTTATEWTAIEIQTVVNLAPSTDKTLTFYWNTTDITPGIYQIKAEASVVLGETDTTDNVYINGIVTVTAFAHDVAIISVTLSDIQVYAGEIVNVTVITENQGTETETFNVTVNYENATLAIFGTVGTQQVASLAPNDNVTLIFSWNTTDVQPCVNYTIIAEASILPNELDTADNTYIDGKVKADLAGDINDDGTVDIADKWIMNANWGDAFTPENPDYEPRTDLDGDGVVNVVDKGIMNANWGLSC